MRFELIDFAIAASFCKSLDDIVIPGGRSLGRSPVPRSNQLHRTARAINRNPARTASRSYAQRPVREPRYTPGAADLTGPGRLLQQNRRAGARRLLLRVERIFCSSAARNRV